MHAAIQQCAIFAASETTVPDDDDLAQHVHWPLQKQFPDKKLMPFGDINPAILLANMNGVNLDLKIYANLAGF